MGTLEEIEKVVKNDWPPYKNLLSILCFILHVLTIYLFSFFGLMLRNERQVELPFVLLFALMLKMNLENSILSALHKVGEFLVGVGDSTREWE